MTTMKPIAAAGIGALVSGLAFYAVGARAAQNNGWAELPAVVQTVDGRYVRVPGAEALPYPQPMGYMQPMAQPVAYVASNGQIASVQPAAAPVLARQSPAPARRVYRQAPQERVVVERAEPRRSTAKTALIIGGSAASGAGVGGLIGGGKGALVGAAIGGGAASIYEATRRR
jgi:hypothetical protein